MFSEQVCKEFKKTTTTTKKNLLSNQPPIIKMEKKKKANFTIFPNVRHEVKNKGQKPHLTAHKYFFPDLNYNFYQG